MIIDNESLPVIAAAFGISAAGITPMTQGLINFTYCVTDKNGNRFLLQRVNNRIFQQPVLLQENFLAITSIISKAFTTPELIKTITGDLLYTNEMGCWRCFSFLENSFAPGVIESEQMAYQVARCFGKYTMLLSSATPKIHTILPGFHDLDLRCRQLSDSIGNALPERLARCEEMLQWVKDYDWLAELYNVWINDPHQFPQRILHHDCKVSNILFDKNSNALIGPIDFDTTQPGLFFSDLGDMIRSIAPDRGEDAAAAGITIRKKYLRAVMKGYLAATAGLWTAGEQSQLHLGGHILLYMQAIRFLVDYLNNDSYYQVMYEQQNFDRALNQWAALHALNNCLAPDRSEFRE